MVVSHFLCAHVLLHIHLQVCYILDIEMIINMS